MNNNEKIFRLLGWKDLPFHEDADYWPSTARWFTGDGEYFGSYLPDISNNYELCRQYIIPEMIEKGYHYQIILTPSYDTFKSHFQWGPILDDGRWGPLYGQVIKDDNIATALVESAIQVLESE